MGADLEYDEGALDALENHLAGAVMAVPTKVQAVLNYYAPIVETWMKQNRPWIDRTNAARSGLYTLVVKEDGAMVLLLSHGANVPYGIWLELKGYAILGPALDHFFPMIMASIRRAIGTPLRGIATGPAMPGSGVYRIRGIT